MSRPPVCWIYTRVSTAQQEVSPEEQHRRCVEFVERHFASKGYLLGEVIHDVCSAYEIPFFNRPGGARLAQQLRSGDVIVALRQDRVFRSLADYTLALRFLSELGCRLVLTDSFQSDELEDAAPTILSREIMASIASYESRIKSERVKDAHRALERNLNPWRAVPPWGWKYVYQPDGTGDFKPNKAERRFIAMLLEMNRSPWGVGPMIVGRTLWCMGARRNCKRSTAISENPIMQAIASHAQGYPLEGYRWKRLEADRAQVNALLADKPQRRMLRLGDTIERLLPYVGGPRELFLAGQPPFSLRRYVREQARVYSYLLLRSPRVILHGHTAWRAARFLRDALSQKLLRNDTATLARHVLSTGTVRELRPGKPSASREELHERSSS